MTFDGPYLDLARNKIKGIIDYFGHTSFVQKSVLDLGCGHADIGGALYRLGADTTVVDARQEHLKVVGKKFPGIKVIFADLDHNWPFANKKFDFILDLDLVCHLHNFENHIRNVCHSANSLVLETAVCDSNDPYKAVSVPENNGIYHLSFTGMASYPTAACIERLLKECGMSFARIDNVKFNSGNYIYNWKETNDGSFSERKRRIWFAVKNNISMQSNNDSNITPIFVPAPTTQLSLLYDELSKISMTNNSNITKIAPSIITQTQEPDVVIQNVNQLGDKKFVIVIPSYNNEKWCIDNITSTINQNYDKYRVIFTDDCSSDSTFEKVSEVIRNSNKYTLIKNEERLGALANLYNMIHSCNDDEIILTLDGDDWLANPNVLNTLNSVYSQDVWMTYGQYQNYPDNGIGVAKEYPHHIIESNRFRSHEWGASHLRTFYAWLFKKINKQDLLYNNKFMSMAWDMAMMLPMLEMSGLHSKFIPDILYRYNLDNPINDHKVDGRLQQSLDRYVRGLSIYNRILSPPKFKKHSIGLMMIATGKYDKFIQNLITSADQYFLNEEYDVTYYIFTDSNIEIVSKRNIVKINIPHRPFPFASMDRFKHFTQNAEIFNKEDFLYYVDVDCRFVNKIDFSEIVGNLVAVRHCGYYNGGGTFEDNLHSCMYQDPNKFKYYFGGGFSGGAKDKYLELAQWCYDHIEKDVSNNIIPRFHDETALNRYLLVIEPDRILSPSFHYPESNLEHYKTKWNGENFIPKIILLDKNHTEIRS